MEMVVAASEAAEGRRGAMVDRLKSVTLPSWHPTTIWQGAAGAGVAEAKDSNGNGDGNGPWLTEAAAGAGT